MNQPDATRRGAPQRYRQDIDGLRAIAVAVVVLCHVHAPGFAGGFIGVDVFFVISGFLIWQLACREIDDRGSFDVAAFYERRARRILPALLLTLLLTLLFGSLVLVAPQLLALGEATLWSLGFLGNVHANNTSGYFDPEGALRPLLHLWSLGIEEQYYLFFPLLAASYQRHRRNTSVALSLLALASLALATAQMWPDASGLWRSPSGVFFGLPTRAWELLAGALLSQLPAPASARLGQWSTWMGLAVIGACTACYHEALPFPGPWALPPVLGAVLVLWGGLAANNVALQHPALVWVGSRSYGIYLFHWPVMVLLRVGFPELETWMQAILCISITIALSIASLALIEDPIRHRRFGPTRKKLITAMAGGAALVTLAAGLLVVLHRDSSVPMPRQAYEEGTCLLLDHQANNKHAPSCLRPHTHPRVVLLGDSHAAHYTAPLRQALAADGITLGMLARTNCVPRLNNDADACSALSRELLSALKSDPPDAAVVSARFMTVDLATPNNPTRAFLSAVQALPLPLVVISQGPEFNEDANVLLSRRIDTAISEVSQSVFGVKAALSPLPHVVDPISALCQGTACPLRDEQGQALYVDRAHLSAAGAARVVPHIVGTLRTVVPGALSLSRGPPSAATPDGRSLSTPQ